VVALESTALSLAKTIVQKAAGAWIADRRTAEESKKELSALLTPKFRRAAPEQRFLDVAESDLASFSHEFRGLDDGERAAALQTVRNTFERADLTDRALFAVDVDAEKLARRLRAGQPRAKTAAGLGEAGGAFYDAALHRCCELYVRAVVQVPTFVGRSSAEILNRLSDLPDQLADRVAAILREAQAAVADPDGGVTVAGRLLEEVTDPFDLRTRRRGCRTCRRMCRASTMRCWARWCTRRRRAAAGPRCWWADPPRARPGPAGKPCRSCGTSRSRGDCGIRSTRLTPTRRCGSCRASGRAPWCG